MTRILIVDHGDTRISRAIRGRYPDAEVITPEEAKERNIVIDSPRMTVIGIFQYFKRSILLVKLPSQPWKRRGKNTKV